MGSVISQVFPPKSKFNVEDIPDLSGKVMIVTGANTGVFQLDRTNINTLLLP